MEITLTKSQEFKLEPFGRFAIRITKTTKNLSPRTIPFSELKVEHETGYPLGDKEEDFITYLKKNKTDILTDGSYFGYYTQINGHLVRVFHPNSKCIEKMKVVSEPL
ncbi:MAG: hypothetical protein U5L95_02500 [Candidatus Saccharibacteria bacterium]|nr:hypothetical protein [Candidatus Saccharibacteria bacterium]